MLDESYNLLGKLGYGEFGEVWKGELRHDSHSPRTAVAIKIFKKTCKEVIINNELAVNAELMLLEHSIKHPNLVRVMNVDLLQGANKDTFRKVCMCV